MLMNMKMLEFVVPIVGLWFLIFSWPFLINCKEKKSNHKNVYLSSDFKENFKLIE